ncbi:MAG TPA: oxygen-independent coproporphyrinogen III oxidase [Geminicoccaceae bacterium]
MEPDRLARYDRRVPRYTSYPTAPHLHPGVGADACGRWLEELPDGPLSLYLHIPFCDTLCWFCGCHTKIVRRYAPVAGYLETLESEIELVARRIGAGRRVRHIHFGGGSPTILEPADLCRLGDGLRRWFEVEADAEIAVEIDPRGLDRARILALAAIGVNRASLGVQDVNPEVQRAVNRVQPFETTARVASWLRDAGIEALNVDLMYGLPHQTVADVERTAGAALRLDPDRLALFGYAHVPWLKRHQRLIDEAALPGAVERWRQFQTAHRRLEAAGYRPIGLDHFARPGDPLARALADGRLRRNFQGYTADPAPVLLGFGASAIGSLPQGYVQNAVPVRAWGEAIRAGRLATVRGLELDDEDRLRRAVIERLMCDLEVDLEAVGRRFGVDAGHFMPELDALAGLAADRIVVIGAGGRIRVPDEARPLVRVVAAVFDQYLDAAGAARHARAV